METREISVKDIYADPNQPRKNFDTEYIRSLGESLKKEGQQHPIAVRPITSKGKISGYTLIFGECRWRAAQMAGLENLKAEVHEISDSKEILKMQLIENERKNLDPMEKIAAYKTAMDAGFSLEETATIFHVSVVTVDRDVKLLELPPAVRNGVDRGYIAKHVAHYIRELPKGRWMQAFSWAMKNPGNSGRMIGAIAAQIEKSSQGSLWGDLPRKNGDVLAIVDGKAVTLKDGAGVQARLMRTIEKFLEIYGGGNEKMALAAPQGVNIVSHIVTTESLAEVLAKAGKTLKETVEKWKADPDNAAKIKAAAEKTVKKAA